jgi:hypothetical protein
MFLTRLLDGATYSAIYEWIRGKNLAPVPFLETLGYTSVTVYVKKEKVNEFKLLQPGQAACYARLGDFKPQIRCDDS